MGHYYYFMKRRASGANVDFVSLNGAMTVSGVILCLLGRAREISTFFEAQIFTSDSNLQ